MLKSEYRKEKNCLNCGYTVEKFYCSNCGQENLEPKEPFWKFLTHLVRLNLAFDGKFSITLKTLFLKPGLISKEYIQGKRASYIHPIRMYLFVSFLLFFLFFIFYSTKKIPIGGKTLPEIQNLSSIDFKAFTEKINNGTPMSRAEFKHYSDSVLIGDIHFTEEKYRDKAEYDSLLKAGVVKDNWLKIRDTYKRLEINERFKDNPSAVNLEIFEAVLHSIPRVIFLSLPLLALWLKFIYFRKKEYNYVSHAIFAVHFLIFVLICVLGMMAIQGLGKLIGWPTINYASIIIGLGILYYLCRAMRNFYPGKTLIIIAKYILFTLVFFLTLGILFSTFFISSFYAV